MIFGKKTERSAPEDPSVQTWHRCIRMKKRDKYLICSIAAVVIYAAASFILAVRGNALPDALTAGWFAFWGTEIWHLARIRINDNKGDNENGTV